MFCLRILQVLGAFLQAFLHFLNNRVTVLYNSANGNKIGSQDAYSNLQTHYTNVKDELVCIFAGRFTNVARLVAYSSEKRSKIETKQLLVSKTTK